MTRHGRQLRWCSVCEGKRNGSVKRFIVVFTCALVRAVHLVLFSDMTVNSYLLALRRFISRRGLPCVIYSDNALTFKAASRDLKLTYGIIHDV